MAQDSQGNGQGKSRDVLLDVKNFLADIGIYEDKAVHICIFFADLVGSTEFKRYHSAREGLAKVVQHNEVVRECVEAFGGCVVKYIGDGVMAMFEEERCEYCALEAGLKAIREMKVVSERQKWDFPFSMVTKIGIHSGPVWMFKYDTSDEDPQGTTVDIASRLVSLAGPNQILCTKQVYETASQTGQLPKPSTEFKRYLKGVRERFDLTSIIPEGYIYEPPDVEGPPHEIEARLKEAYRLVNEKKPDKAVEAFKRISDDHQDNYIANTCVAEYLLREISATDQQARNMLERVEDHINRAMCCRPNSCHLWLLYGSMYFKYFEIDGDTLYINKAIDCTRKAIRLAYDWQNKGGMLQAKVCLIQFLQKLAWESRDSNVLDEARKLCIELEPFVLNAFNYCRSIFYVAYASVQIQSGSTDFESIEKMIKMAKEFSPSNIQVYDVERELIKHRYHNVGLSGTSEVSPFE